MSPGAPSSTTPHHSHSHMKATMGQPQRTPSQDSQDAIRKRVCKACDRCRLKKSKCDGSHPCSRCKADNAICVFGERKKTHDKVYPKGYVEMLEQQQSQLVAGLQEMYKRLHRANAWPGSALSESSGHPLTHDILAALNLLEVKSDEHGEPESFEEDCQKLQDRLIAGGAGFVPRRGSFSSDSEHSQPGHDRTASQQTHHHQQQQQQHAPPTTNLKRPIFPENFSFASPPPSPRVQSIGVKTHARQQFQHQHLPRQSYPPTQTSPLSNASSSPLANDPPVFQQEWAMGHMQASELMMRSKFALQTPDLSSGLTDVDTMFETCTDFDDLPTTYSPNFNHGVPVTSYSGATTGVFSNDFGYDPMEFELNKYISVQ